MRYKEAKPDDWIVDFYERANGRKPALEFFNSLSTDEKVFVARGFKRLEEHGNKLPRPHSAPLGNGLFELRVRFMNVRFRFIYFF